MAKTMREGWADDERLTKTQRQALNGLSAEARKMLGRDFIHAYAVELVTDEARAAEHREEAIWT